MIGAVAYWKGWRAVSLVLLALVVAYLVIFALRRPAWEWDSVFYTMAALHGGLPDAAAVHAKALALTEAQMTRDAFEAMVNASPIRQAHRADAAAMASYLPLYEVKTGYVALLRLLAPLADPPHAMRAVALACSLGTLALLFGAAWRAAGLATLAWLPLAALFNLSSHSTMMAPDPLATFLYGVAIAAMLSGRLGVAAALLVGVTFVRPDSVALNLVLAVAVAVESRRLALVVALGSLAAYAADIALSGHVGWWRQFMASFTMPPHDLATYHPAFSPATYLSVLAAQVTAVAHMPWVQAALGLAIIAIMLAASRGDSPDGRRAGRLAIALVVGMALRFAIYPSAESRHYEPALFGLCLVALRAAPRR